MRIYTRKVEKDAIVAILNDDTHTEDSMADAILKTAYGLLLERDWFLTVQGSGATFGYGLSSTEGEAKKLALVSPAVVLPISSAAALQRRMEE